MSNDLLFSVLPRRGTVPVKADRGEVKKIVKKMPLHASPEEENIPIVNPREQQHKDQQHQQNQHQAKDYSDEHIGLIVDTTDDAASQPNAEEQENPSTEQASAKDNEDDTGSGTHLDIEV